MGRFGGTQPVRLSQVVSCDGRVSRRQVETKFLHAGAGTVNVIVGRAYVVCQLRHYSLEATDGANKWHGASECSGTQELAEAEMCDRHARIILTPAPLLSSRDFVSTTRQPQHQRRETTVQHHNTRCSIVTMASARAPSSTPVPTTETAESSGATSTVTEQEWEAMANLLKNVYDYRIDELVVDLDELMRCC